MLCVDTRGPWRGAEAASGSPAAGVASERAPLGAQGPFGWVRKRLGQLKSRFLCRRQIHRRRSGDVWRAEIFLPNSEARTKRRLKVCFSSPPAAAAKRERERRRSPAWTRDESQRRRSAAAERKRLRHGQTLGARGPGARAPRHRIKLQR